MRTLFPLGTRDAFACTHGRSRRLGPFVAKLKQRAWRLEFGGVEGTAEASDLQTVSNSPNLRVHLLRPGRRDSEHVWSR